MASILVLEDDFLLAHQIGDWLTDASHTVVGPASSIDQALAASAEAGIDAALLDVDLGDGLRSYELARILAAQRIPFAFLSGFSPSLTPPDLRNHPRLDKPFERHQVLQAVRHMLEPIPAAGQSTPRDA
jgi:DNA-binding response OmpR family regulator